MRVHRHLTVLALLAGTVHVTGCVAEAGDGHGDLPTEGDEPIEGDPSIAAQPGVESDPSITEPAPAAAASQLFELDLTGTEAGDAAELARAIAESRSPEDLDVSDKPTSSCPTDVYLHPYNGSHGGWIARWRLCNEGYLGNGQWQFRICDGGTAPVRYWSPSSCGSPVHNWYPQGWRGWAQTFGSCC